MINFKSRLISHFLHTGLISMTLIFGHPAARGQELAAPERPSLIVGIVVDGMKSEWIDKFWNLFGEGGFKKLVRQGARYTDVNVPFLLADLGSSTASISTGAPPALHGIVSEKWFNRLTREEIQCTGDFHVKSVGTVELASRQSPGNLLAPTIGDCLIQSSGFTGLTVSVSLSPEASILLGGHLSNACYWHDMSSGSWVTSSHFRNELPTWVVQFNQRNTSANYLTREWDLMLADNLYKACLPDDNQFETGFFNQFRTFPYKMNRLRKESLSQDYEILHKVPYGNSLVTDFAITACLSERLGKDANPDILWISYTVINELNLLFGPDSREVADAMLRLDMDIQRLIYQTEESVGKNNTLIFLTSTHGTAADPDYSRALKLPGGFFRYRNAMALLNSYLSAIYGDGNWIESYINHQVYLNEALIDQKKESFQVIQDQASRFLTHFEGVARAIPADRLINGALTQSWGDLVQNSYQPDRTGDILIILQPGWIEEDNHDSDSGSPYPYDRQVPLVWYGWKVRPALIERPVSILDIAPTIARSIMIARPEASTGSPLTEIFK